MPREGTPEPRSSRRRRRPRLHQQRLRHPRPPLFPPPRLRQQRPLPFRRRQFRPRWQAGSLQPGRHRNPSSL